MCTACGNSVVYWGALAVGTLSEVSRICRAMDWSTAEGRKLHAAETCQLSPPQKAVICL